MIFCLEYSEVKKSCDYQNNTSKNLKSNMKKGDYRWFLAVTFASWPMILLSGSS